MYYFIINNGNIGLVGCILFIELIDNGSVIYFDLVNLFSIFVLNFVFNMIWGMKKFFEVKDLFCW